MVDGVGNNNLPSQLRLKGKDGQTINLENLKGLQKTEQNKALFDMYDKNKDGKIDNDEAIVMKRNLQSLAGGNNIISKQEMKALFGDNNKAAFEALSKLADQQAAYEKGSGEYVEVNGNRTTHVYKGSTENSSYRYDEIKSENGSVYQMDDGSQEIRLNDGRRLVTSADGVETLYNKDGKGTLMKFPDGHVEYFSLDGNSKISKNAEGQTISKQELKNGQEITTNYEYVDGKTIAREYNMIDGQNQLTSITLSGKGVDASNGKSYTGEIRYSSEEDFQNNRPLSETRNKGLPTELNIKYSYDDQGNVKIETKNSAGDVTVKYTDAEGNEIKGNQFDAPETYTVQSGQSITQIVTNMLKNKGIDNPTPEQLTAAKKELLEANSDQVQTMESGKYKGNKYFYANAQIVVPKFESLKEKEITYDGGTLPTVDVVAKAPTQEAKELRAQLQKVYGNDFEVTYSPDGQLEVRTKEGELLADETKEANAMLATSDEEDLASIMRDADTITKDNQIDKKEYNQYISNMLSNVGFEITDSNRVQVQQLIENSFNSMDTLSPDGKISQEELQKNAKAIIQKLTDDLLNVDNSVNGNNNQETSQDGDAIQLKDNGIYFA